MRRRVAALGQRVEERPAGKRQADPLADLVEHLAHGVVAGLGHGVQAPAAFLRFDQQRVATRHHQPHEPIRRRRRLLATLFQPGRVEVRLEVVHPVEGNAARPGDGTPDREPDQQRSDQARTSGRRHHVDVVEHDAGALERLVTHRRPVAQVLARCDLRHHSAPLAMRFELARHHRGEHAGAAVEDGARGVVARGLDAQHQRTLATRWSGGAHGIGQCATKASASIFAPRRPRSSSRVLVSLRSTMTRLRTLDHLLDADLRGRAVFVRADFNVPRDGDRILDDTRIRAAVPTLRELQAAGAKLLVFSHYGRPKGKPRPDQSLRPVATALAAIVGADVAFAPDCVGAAAEAAAAATPAGGYCLFENLRFHAGEEANDPEFAAQLARLAEPLRRRRVRRGAPRPRLDRGRAGAGRAQRGGAASGPRGRGTRAPARRARGSLRRDPRRRQDQGQDRDHREPAAPARRASPRRRHGEHLPARARLLARKVAGGRRRGRPRRDAPRRRSRPRCRGPAADRRGRDRSHRSRRSERRPRAGSRPPPSTRWPTT